MALFLKGRVQTQAQALAFFVQIVALDELQAFLSDDKVVEQTVWDFHASFLLPINT
jgi:hypothetical protein